ncbi:YrhB domain-containing protein [Amycolatopsis rhabdoformis]|uniref:YrhB domain-containing protein n=1 Tax=Amycolatopsis rhabdoformis TaxID=1448059 RepID=A0ABZ1IFT8_9PSEU|nr:YrhB domain-containing protein [Amycolatopsis rhabdoformis]WSE32335.1 YrhB domain-containing protein [Amycolatopsis rhabdoformis]
MVSEGWAVEVVERYLAEPVGNGGVPLVVTDVSPHRLGWVVETQGERYVRTRDIVDMLVGHGPFLVDGLDGSLHQVHVTADLENGEWIEEYLEQVRGVERVDPMRSRTAELLDSGQRVEALRFVRSQAPDLGVQGAKEYVEAVVAGVPVPDHVRSRLPQPPARRTVRWALSAPNREPVRDS